jgi:hypothetical protein
MTSELFFAVLQFVPHRLVLVAIAGSVLSDRDKKEFRRMSDEKVAGFSESLLATAMKTTRVNTMLAASLFAHSWVPARKRRASLAKLAAPLSDGGLGIMAKGLKPLYRGATDNALRLAATRLR